MLLVKFQKLLKHRNIYAKNTDTIFEEKPVGIREFLESPIYCPAPKQVRPAIKKMLIDIF